MAQANHTAIPPSQIYAIHQDTKPIPCTKKSGKTNFEVSHFFSNHKWSLDIVAYLQGYAPPSYNDFIPYIPNATLEMAREGGSRHQAHPCVRHVADIFHAQAWGDFQRRVNAGATGVFVGSKYSKDIKRAQKVFDFPVHKALDHFPKEAKTNILNYWNSVKGDCNVGPYG